MIKKIWEGREIMLFDEDGKSFAYSQNHTLNLTINTSDVASKDHGVFNSTTVTNIGWEITSSNLACDEFHKLFFASVAHEPILVKFGIKKESDTLLPADGDIECYTLDGGELYYTGKALITSLNLSAQNGEKSTYDITLTGVSKLVQTDDLTTMSVDEDGAFDFDPSTMSCDVYLPEPINKLSFFPHVVGIGQIHYSQFWQNESGQHILNVNVYGNSDPCGVEMIHYEDDNITLKKVNLELYVKQRETPYQASNPTITIKSVNDTTYNLSVDATTGESEHIIVEVPVPNTTQGNLMILISNNIEQDNLCVKDIELKYYENN